MTRLEKPIRRQTNGLVFEIHPPVRDEDAVIRIREKFCRIWYETTMMAVYHMAIKQTIERRERETGKGRRKRN